MEPDPHDGQPESDAPLRRPLSLSVAMAIILFELLVTAALVALAFVLAAKSRAGELTAFQTGMVEGFGYAPGEFDAERAAYFAGTLFPLTAIRCAYLVGILARWRTFLVAILVLDAFATLSGMPCCLVAPALMAALILNRGAQAYLKE